MPKNNRAEWTVGTLKVLVFSRLAEMDKRNQQRFSAQQEALLEARVRAAEAVTAALAAADKAAEKAEADNKQWRATTDEWRRSLTDITQKNINRDEFERAISNLEATISAAIITRQQVTDDLRNQINAVATSLRDYMPREQSEGAHRTLEAQISTVAETVPAGAVRSLVARVAAIEAWQTWGQRLVLGLVIAAVIGLVLSKTI